MVDLDRFNFTLLNGSAAILWLALLDRERSHTDLTADLAEVFGQQATSLRADVDRMLSQWRELGWLRSADAERVVIPAWTDAPSLPPYTGVARAQLEAAVAGTVVEWARDMDFLGTPVSVRFLSEASSVGSDASIRAASFLGGLPPSDTASDQPVFCHVAETGIYLRLGDSCVKAADVSDALSRLVLWCFYLAYGTENFLGTFHAAAVGRESGAILMPGVSGVGKSTLTAYLAAHGWLYGGDDIIGLAEPADGDGRKLVLPFCSSISVKDGAVSLLGTFYPGLGDCDVVAYDTKHARFPSVPRHWQMGADPAFRRIGAIVFPQYAPGVETRLTPLGLRETLLALVGIGYRAGERMDARLLEGLFDFLETTPKYRLAFCDLAAAEVALRQLPCN